MRNILNKYGNFISDKHDPPKKYIDKYGKDNYNKYFTFAFVRNPFDWQVSLYHYISLHNCMRCPVFHSLVPIKLCPTSLPLFSCPLGPFDTSWPNCTHLYPFLAISLSWCASLLGGYQATSLPISVALLWVHLTLLGPNTHINIPFRLFHCLGA